MNGHGPEAEFVRLSQLNWGRMINKDVNRNRSVFTGGKGVNHYLTHETTGTVLVAATLA